MELQQPQLEKLSQSSQLFFDCHEEMNSNQKEREIMRLVKEWGKLWRKQIYTPPNFVVENRKNYDKSVVDTDVLQNGVETVDRLAHILLDMKEKSLNLSNIKTKPSPKKGKTRSNHNHDVIFNVAVGGWAKAPPSQMNGIKASKILKRVEDIYRKCPENLKVVQPSSMSYGAAIHAWSISVDSPNINGAIEAERILEDMKKAYTSGNNPFAKPSIIAYNSCLQGYSLRGMVKEVEVLLNEMEKHCDKIDSSNNESNDCLCPDVVSYTICINAYAKSKSKNAANRAEKLLQKMVKRFERTGNIRFRPNQYTFGSVIALYTKNNAYEGAQNAERILQWLIGLYEKELNSFNDEGNGTSTEYLKPSILHFMTVLLAYSSRRIRGAAVKAQKLLVQMENLYQAGNEDLKPTYKCFIICLDILVKSNEKDAAEKAEQVLDRLEDSYLNDRDSELNNYAYNLVLNAWARSGDKGAFERSEKVINRMKVVYNKTLNKTVRPDKVSYTALMNTLINTREPGFADRSAAILSHMEQQYLKGDKEMKPDTIAYATVIKAFGRAGIPKAVEGTLQRMEELSANGDQDVSPNISCYNGLINAYAKSHSKNSSDMVEGVLRRIDEARKNGKTHLKPNNVTYTSCLDALARSGAENRVERAEGLFKRMIEEEMAIDLSSWNVLLLVYAKSNLEDKAKKGSEVLQRMRSLGLKPTVVTYNTLLNTCSNSLITSENTRKQVLEIAVKEFGNLLSIDNLKPDSTTYCTLFWICHSLINDTEEKNRTIERTFQMCCRDGQVNRKVLWVLRKTSSNHLFWKLLNKNDGYGYVAVDDLPPEWSRNSNRNSIRLNWMEHVSNKHRT